MVVPVNVLHQRVTTIALPDCHCVNATWNASLCDSRSPSCEGHDQNGAARGIQSDCISLDRQGPKTPLGESISIQIDCCINPSRLSRLSGLSDQDESLVSQTALRTNNFGDATSGVSFPLLIAGALGACALTATLLVLRRRRRRKRNIKSKLDTLQTNPIESPKLSETSQLCIRIHPLISSTSTTG